MTDLDLDRLGDVWRQQPDPAELERLRRSAIAVARRARFARIVDIGGAIAVGAAVIALVVLNPTIETSLVGAAVLLVLLGSNIRLRNLRQVELKSLSGSTEDMLDQTIERIETTVKYNRFLLIIAVPAMLVGGLFITMVGLDLYAVFGTNLHSPKIRVVGLAAFAGVIAYLFVATRRNRRELGRLRAMRESYRYEREKSAP
ncbi:MAG TPA: hypothetical protein VEX35_05340 [Allosphingosinicella sp.]|nr:hypothetical protein [Allosphingosinicella sp.]